MAHTGHRSRAAIGGHLQHLREQDVLFGLGSSVYDCHDPFGNLFRQTLAIVAGFEANQGHLRTREGMAEAREGQAQGQTAETASHRAQDDPPPVPRPSRTMSPTWGSLTPRGGSTSDGP
ncbi:recombinase family protein [Nocardia testacea]|uniref:recombinase family protein n=1 Tax=Nocardia testacea TaxID=248551 RepID=UPI003407CC1D